MNGNRTNPLGILLAKDPSSLLNDWMKNQSANGGAIGNLKESELREQSREFLELLTTAAHNNSDGNIQSTEWTPVLDFLADISRRRARQGLSREEPKTSDSVFFCKELKIFDKNLLPIFTVMTV